MPNKVITFEKGLVTARDPSTLGNGQLQTARGCEYRKGSPHIYKQPGRRATSISLNSKVTQIQRIQYNDVTISDSFESEVNKLVYTTADGRILESDAFTTADAAKSASLVLAGQDTTYNPYFTSQRSSWLVFNGVTTNQIREPDTIPGGSTNYRALGMLAPSRADLTFATVSQGSSTEYADGTDTAILVGGYTNPTRAYDGSTTTNARGRISNRNIDVFDNPTLSVSHRWTWGADDGNSSRTVRITHSGEVNKESGTISASQRIYLFLTSTNSIIYDSSWKLPYNKRTTAIPLDDAVDLTTLQVYASLTVLGDVDGAAIGRIYDIRSNTNGNPTSFTISNNIDYAITERYVDSQGVEHESAIGPVSTIEAAADINGITISGIPATPENAFTSSYIIYRSLDEGGGGYPFMYQIDELTPDTTGAFPTTYSDIGDISFSDVTVQGKPHDVLPVLYPSGEVLYIERNAPPPVALKAVPYYGSMVYMPRASTRIHYSIPATISPVASELVPEYYYLQFETPVNDIIRSIEVANSGKSLIVYFDRYSMLVTQLPQATDPSVFDQRITEYVSNTRGCAGHLASTEVTIQSGSTLAVAVDALGLWATDGVSVILEWSNQIDWAALTDGVDLSRVKLINNPQLYRLEMLYEKNGRCYEMHFFYDRLEDNSPVASGPHPMGVCVKHYSNIDGKWAGWSGEDSAPGRIFVEREQAADDAFGYDDVTRSVPFLIRTGDDYVDGLGTSTIVTEGFPKFGSNGIIKPVTFTGSFRRDGFQTPSSKSKYFIIGTQKKLYWAAYADRHSIEIKDTSDTDMPPLVAYEISTRPAGGGKE